MKVYSASDGMRAFADRIGRWAGRSGHGAAGRAKGAGRPAQNGPRPLSGGRPSGGAKEILHRLERTRGDVANAVQSSRRSEQNGADQAEPQLPRKTSGEGRNGGSPGNLGGPRKGKSANGMESRSTATSLPSRKLRTSSPSTRRRSVRSAFPRNRGGHFRSGMTWIAEVGAGVLGKGQRGNSANEIERKRKNKPI